MGRAFNAMLQRKKRNEMKPGLHTYCAAVTSLLLAIKEDYEMAISVRYAKDLIPPTVERVVEELKAFEEVARKFHG